MKTPNICNSQASGQKHRQRRGKGEAQRQHGLNAAKALLTRPRNRARYSLGTVDQNRIGAIVRPASRSVGRIPTARPLRRTAGPFGAIDAYPAEDGMRVKRSASLSGQCQARPDFLMLPPFCASANDATRGSWFSSRSAPCATTCAPGSPSPRSRWQSSGGAGRPYSDGPSRSPSSLLGLKMGNRLSGTLT
jgi:hypothetical protein